VLALVTLGLSGLLALVTVLAAWRTRSVRFLFAALAFGGFTARSLLFVLGREGVLERALVPANTTSLVIDALVVGFLYLAIVKE